MNDTNRLMFAIGIALLAYESYPESWITFASSAFIIIAAISELIHQTKDGIERFSQMMDPD